MSDEQQIPSNEDVQAEVSVHETQPATVEVAAPAPAPEPVYVPEPAPAPEPEPVPAPAPAPARRQPSPYGSAVSGNDRDVVTLAACVFKNKFARKSLTIHHVQRRLAELGYGDAAADRDGWYGDLTKSAVRAYQSAEGLAGDGVIDAATLESLFADDPNVTVES